MNARLACSMLAITLLVTGCASQAAPPTAPSTPQSPSLGAPSSASSPATPDYARIAAANKRQASDAADHMLTLAELPPGAARTTSTPRAVRSPLSYPATSSLLDHSATWQVAMSFDDTLAWIDAHPPKGLTKEGSSRGSGVGGGTAGRTYSAPETYPGGTAASHSWGDAWLQVALTPLDDGETAIRVDGMAMWLDPKPFRDNAQGARLRLTVGGGCPTSDKGDGGVRNSGADLTVALLPHATPTAALLCDYRGVNGADARTLIRSQRLDASDAARLASAVTQSRLSHYDDVRTSCPAAFETATVLAFSYPGRDDVDIWYSTSSCQHIANGFISAAPSDALDELVNPSASGPPFPTTSAAS